MNKSKPSSQGSQFWQQEVSCHSYGTVFGSDAADTTRVRRSSRCGSGSGTRNRPIAPGDSGPCCQDWPIDLHVDTGNPFKSPSASCSPCQGPSTHGDLVCALLINARRLWPQVEKRNRSQHASGRGASLRCPQIQCNSLPALAERPTGVE